MCRPTPQTTREAPRVEHCRRAEYLFEEKVAATFLLDPKPSLDSLCPYVMLTMLPNDSYVDTHCLQGGKCT